MGFKYRATVLEELARHGISPREDTPPELVHDFVNNLYLFQIRNLKRKMVDGEIPKDDYANRVDELRRQHPILSLPMRFWLEP